MKLFLTTTLALFLSAQYSVASHNLRGLQDDSGNRRRCFVSIQCPGTNNTCGEDNYCTKPDPDISTIDRNEDLPSFGSCVADIDCPPIQCFVAPCDVNVCDTDTNTCQIQPAGDDDLPQDFPEVGDRFDDPILIDIEDPILVGEDTTVIDTNVTTSDEEEPNNKTDSEIEDLSCGSNTCQSGEVCCNPSCGYCTAPNGRCTKEFCIDTLPLDEPITSEEADEPSEAEEPSDSGITWPKVYRGDCTCGDDECAVCYQIPYVGTCIEMGCSSN